MGSICINKKGLPLQQSGGNSPPTLTASEITCVNESAPASLLTIRKYILQYVTIWTFQMVQVPSFGDSSVTKLIVTLETMHPQCF